MIRTSAAYSILEIRNLTETTLRIRTERPNVDIRAGQCFNVGIPGTGINREYSMYSAATAPYLDFLIKVIEGGCVTPSLQLLRTGDKLEIDGPYGEFTIKEKESTDQKYIFLASGTGIAPFHSFVLSYPGLKYRVIHGIRKPTEKYGEEDFVEGEYVACISENEANKRSSRVTDYLRDEPIEKDSMVYICGNRSMIIDSVDILLAQGLPGDQIITEVFF